jgi:RNA polymerase sigma factor (sigma-70 family)
VAHSPWPVLARHLSGDTTDAELLARYLTDRDGEAFARLVARYSRLVWGQCRNLLPTAADAEDAFQATFLVLARSARSIRTGAPLGPWLHGVAFRVCRNARRAAARRARHATAGARPEQDRPVAEGTWEEVSAAVAEEVQRLPEGQRQVFVLCGLEGRTEVEAAASLGQKVGTISSRLARAKRTLLARLTKRGLGFGTAALGALAGGVADAPAALVHRAGCLIAPGTAVPESIRSLTHGVVGMFLPRLKVLVACTVLTAGVALGAAGWLGRAGAEPEPGADVPKAPPSAPAKVNDSKAGPVASGAENPKVAAIDAQLKALAYPDALLRNDHTSEEVAQRTYFTPDDLKAVEGWYRKKLDIDESIAGGVGTFPWPPGATVLAKQRRQFAVVRDDVREKNERESKVTIRAGTTRNFITRTPEGTTVVLINRAPEDRFTMIAVTLLPPEAK